MFFTKYSQQDRFVKLNRLLRHVQRQRKKEREKLRKLNRPHVAVVGYTNAGKTSLIHVLTGDSRLVPENHLFATLDVTTHFGRLDNRMTVAFYDTIGFISDLPTNLMAPFTAILQETKHADVIVHVRDVSHPDRERQKATVLRHLHSIDIAQKKLDNIIEVANKVDKLPEGDAANISFEGDLASDAVVTSLIDGRGIVELKRRLAVGVLQFGPARPVRMRLPQGSDNIRFVLFFGVLLFFVEKIALFRTDGFIKKRMCSPSRLARTMHNFVT